MKICSIKQLAAVFITLFVITACDSPNKGIAERLSNTTCIAPDVRGSLGSLGKEIVFDQYGLFLPISLVPHPSNGQRWYVAEKGGLIKTFVESEGSTTTSLDLTAIVSPLNVGEGGLLDITFDPNFLLNGYLYVSYTEGSSSIVSKVMRYTSSDGGLTFVAATVKEIISVPQPWSNHNGGSIAFGPDNYLYIGLGDGGQGGDPLGSGQDTSTLLGSMLRIDVNTDLPYLIPADNPFVGNPLANSGDCADAACPEIYAYGLRNPWQWSFDSETGDLWVGDVGQSAREEVDMLQLGGNYGWDIKEGFSCFEGDCSTPDLIDPVIDYPRSDGTSITGGIVYRGSSLPGMQGTYIFGDYGSGSIWGLSFDAEGSPLRENIELIPGVASFAEGLDHELYAISIGDSIIYKFIPDFSDADTSVPTMLSETGCVTVDDTQTPIDALLPYDVQQPLWSDSATKTRYIGLPDGSSITIDENDDWIFPIGTVLMKNFFLNEILFETRLLMRHAEGDWAGYSYEWNNEGTDATLVLEGKTTEVQGQTWTFPSTAQCSACHTSVTNQVLGLETAQLNHDYTYPNLDVANQIEVLDGLSIFSETILESVDDLPRLSALDDESQTLESRIKGYLHSNCANCHQPLGTTPSNIDLRYSSSLEDMNICNASALDNMGIEGAQVLMPSDPARSILLQKMLIRGEGQMPPIASHQVDEAATSVLIEWINSFGDC